MAWRPFGAKPLPGTISQFRDNWFKTQWYFIIKQNETNILSSTIYFKTNKNTNTTQSVCEPLSEPMMARCVLKDQTKCFQLRTALLWESAYGCMTTRRLIIQWSQKILIIDITKVALRSKASNNSNITWMEYENNTFPIKESPCPRVAHV